MSVTPIRFTLGEAIRRHRVSAGLSQHELAKSARLHKNYISNAERGCTDISVSRLFAIADALGTTVDALRATANTLEVKDVA